MNENKKPLEEVKKWNEENRFGAFV